MRKKLTPSHIFLIFLIIAISATLLSITIYFLSKNNKDSESPKSTESKEYSITEAWQIKDYIKVLNESGIGVTFDEFCRFKVYSLETGKVTASKDYANIIINLSPVADSASYGCREYPNVYKIPEKPEYIFTVVRKVGEDYEEFLIKFNVADNKFEWITRKPNTERHYLEAIDNYLIDHFSKDVQVYNLETGELIHDIKIFDEIDYRIELNNSFSSVVKKVGDKIYQYSFTKEMFVVVDLIEGKTIKRITVRNSIERTNKSFEWENLNLPEFTMLNDRLALAGDKNYLYIVDLVKGEIEHKLLKSDFGVEDDGTGYEFNWYGPDIFGDIAFVFVTSNPGEKTLVLNYKTGEIIKTYDSSRYYMEEAPEGLMYTDSHSLGLIDKKTFDVIWEIEVPGYTNLRGLNEDGNILFEDNMPDAYHCYQDCSTPRFWIIDINTGEKLKELSRDDISIRHCDEESGDLCLNNFEVTGGDGGWNGFELFDKKTGQKIYEAAEGSYDRGYLYKDLIIYRDCVSKHKSSLDASYEECDYDFKADRIKVK